MTSVENLKNELRTLYLLQQHRGKRGFGLLVRKIRNGYVYRDRKKTKKGIFHSPLWNEIEKGDLVLFHHRRPTSTKNIVTCNHPIANEDRSIFLVHNGFVSGYHSAFHTLLHRHLFETKVKIDGVLKVTDSEVIINRLEQSLTEMPRIDAIRKIVVENHHSVFLTVFRDEHRIYYGANHQDLSQINFGENRFIVSETYGQELHDLYHAYGYLDNNRLHYNDLPSSSLRNYK